MTRLGTNSVNGHEPDNMRVLVVEDDALIALDLADLLINAGLEVVGPATCVAHALDLITSIGCDAALLDVNLGSETSEPVARELIARGTPFVVLSGNSSDSHPPGLRGAIALSKPAPAEDVISALARAATITSIPR